MSLALTAGSNQNNQTSKIAFLRLTLFKCTEGASSDHKCESRSFLKGCLAKPDLAGEWHSESDYSQTRVKGCNDRPHEVFLGLITGLETLARRQVTFELYVRIDKLIQLLN